jgi:transcriptional regulator GlxA family with amidase domain
LTPLAATPEKAMVAKHSSDSKWNDFGFREARSGAGETYRPGFMELLSAEGPGSMADKPSLKVSFTLLPRFTLLAFAGLVDSLRLASDIGDRSRPLRCQWSLVGSDRRPIASSSGAEIAHWETFGDPARFDYVIIVGGLLGADSSYHPLVLDYIRRAARAGVTLVGICTGVFALAQAGVMKGYRCCVHGYHLPEFEQEFPDIEAVTDSIFVVDGDRVTCAGGIAAVDLAGFLIGQRCGRDRAVKILPHLVADELRPPNHPQLPLVDRYFQVYDDRVRRAIFLMEQHIGNPLPVGNIAKLVGATSRQLERAFQRYFRKTPSTFFRLMRLHHARWLILHTTSSVTQIAIDCGFADTPHLTRTFKQTFGRLPTDLRKGAVAPAFDAG